MAIEASVLSFVLMVVVVREYGELAELALAVGVPKIGTTINNPKESKTMTENRVLIFTV
jgi:hypothetical protein